MSNSYPFIHYLCSKQVNYPHGNINKTQKALGYLSHFTRGARSNSKP